MDYLVKMYMPWATEQDKACMRGAISAVKPIGSTIDLYQSLPIPLVVWTNNDQYTYNIKLKKINELRVQAGQLPFEPSAAFTVIATGNAGAEDATNAKPHSEYYKRVYAETCAFFNVPLGDLYIIFIDDNKENVAGTVQAAEQYGIPMQAHYYDGSLNNLERQLIG